MTSNVEAAPRITIINHGWAQKWHKGNI